MSKKILIISSSPRKNSNSEALAASFARGAMDANNEVETIILREKEYSFCKGCLACFQLGHCVIKDDSVQIVEKMHDADILVFATPVYYYSVSGQLKTLLDRANPLYGTDYQFTKVYLMAAAAEGEEAAVSGAATTIQGWVDCFERAEFAGTVFAGLVSKPGDIAGHAALEEAYQLGAQIH